VVDDDAEDGLELVDVAHRNDEVIGLAHPCLVAELNGAVVGGRCDVACDMLREMEERPSGTVTFLLTDIEASTRRWQADRSGMESALVVHDEMLHASVGRHGGQVVKHTGDGILAVFVSAPDALAAAIDAQEVLELPVRMGIHTGEAQLRGGDYFGPTLNRLARLTGAGHGGQILLSATTAALVEEAELADLGAHHLRDVVRAERIWQVGHRTFPPLNVSDQAKGNLRPEPPELFGRSGVRADVCRRLRAERLVSLVGVGGVGKTSLALSVAHAERFRYPDGVWFIELAPVGEPGSLASVIAGAFNHQEQAGVTLDESLRRVLAEQELLLVLDNCEHLLESVHHFVESLLAGSHSLDILVTSREGLGLANEHQLTVPSLSADGVDAPAVQLFAARAAQILDTFVVDDANAATIAAICRELDGNPLAIELAATRVRSLSPTEIRDRLANRLQLLSGRRRVAGRHQTLRDTVRWSYDLLVPGEQALLRSLSVFAGGFSLGAAEVVCEGPGIAREDVLDALDSLVAKSLVVADVRDDTTRYRLLETIRQFAHEELDAAGEAMALHRRYATYFLDTLLRHVVDLGEREDPVGFHWMEAEFDNLRAAFEWMLVNDLEAATRFCVPMGGFGWRLQRYEAGGWPARVIAARQDRDDEVPAELLGAAVHGPLFAGDIDGAGVLVDRALAAARRQPPSGEVIEPWGAAMVQAVIAGDGRRILDLAAETRLQPDRARILDDSTWHYVASAHIDLDDMDASRATAEEADRQLQGRAYAFFADWDMARVLADPAAALARYQRADERADRLGFRFVSLAVRREIGRLRCVTGDPRGAVEVLQPVLEQWFTAGDVTDWTAAASVLTVALSALGDHETTASILGATHDRRGVASALSVLPTSELDRLTDLCRHRLGTDAFDRLYRHGRTASHKELMDLIRVAIGNVLAAPAPPPTSSP
jgi:predicted ATPase/class 3 adenylate cyclase